MIQNARDLRGAQDARQRGPALGACDLLIEPLLLQDRHVEKFQCRAIDQQGIGDHLPVLDQMQEVLAYVLRS